MLEVELATSETTPVQAKKGRKEPPKTLGLFESTRLPPPTPHVRFCDLRKKERKKKWKEVSREGGRARLGPIDRQTDR